MAKLPNQIGLKYGRWLVIDTFRNERGKLVGVCKCECGTIRNVEMCSLRKKKPKSISCGCYFLEMMKTRDITHNLSKTKTYGCWRDMRHRCNNAHYSNYKSYGGRGITVCERWDKFENFLEDMGEKPEGRSLDRIDNNGNYCPENCRWATPKEQSKNMRNNIFIVYNGKQMLLSELSELSGINRETLKYRIFTRNMTPELAVSTPLKITHKKK